MCCSGLRANEYLVQLLLPKIALEGSVTAIGRSMGAFTLNEEWAQQIGRNAGSHDLGAHTAI